MKILLLNDFGTLQGGAEAQLAGLREVLRKRGHQVRLFDTCHPGMKAQHIAEAAKLEKPDEPQIIYDGPPDRIEHSHDNRVSQFVRGEAGERLMEMRQQNGGGSS